MTQLDVMSRDEFMSLKEGSPVYVCNNSDVGRRFARGIVILTVYDLNGHQRTIEVPNTHIPVDLTVFTSTESLQKSDNFRNLYAKQVLVMIKRDSAERFLATTEAKDELNRLEATVKAVTLNDENATFTVGRTNVGGVERDVPRSTVSSSNLSTEELAKKAKEVIRPELISAVEDFMNNKDDNWCASRVRDLAPLAPWELSYAFGKVAATGTAMHAALMNAGGDAASPPLPSTTATVPSFRS